MLQTPKFPPPPQKPKTPLALASVLELGKHRPDRPGGVSPKAPTFANTASALQAKPKNKVLQNLHNPLKEKKTSTHYLSLSLTSGSFGEDWEIWLRPCSIVKSFPWHHLPNSLGGNMI